jgi:hypothetical protein
MAPALRPRGGNHDLGRIRRAASRLLSKAPKMRIHCSCPHARRRDRWSEVTKQRSEEALLGCSKAD